LRSGSELIWKTIYGPVRENTGGNNTTGGGLRCTECCCSGSLFVDFVLCQNDRCDLEWKRLVNVDY